MTTGLEILVKSVFIIVLTAMSLFGIFSGGTEGLAIGIFSGCMAILFIALFISEIKERRKRK